MAAAADGAYATATDLADWLVYEAGLTFRVAHGVSGRIVRMAEEKGVKLDALALVDMQKIEPKITKAVFKVLGAKQSVASRKSFGGTAPVRVRGAIKDAIKRFLKPTKRR